MRHAMAGKWPFQGPLALTFAELFGSFRALRHNQLPAHARKALEVPITRLKALMLNDLARGVKKVTLAACCALVCGAALAQSAPQQTALDTLRTASDRKLQAGVDRVVRGLDLEPAVVTGRLALALVDVSDAAQPRLAMLNGDRMMYAASLPKIAILLGAMVEAELGRLPLNEKTVGAMTNMIRFSSNEDATRVLHWVGGERLIDILQSPRFRFYDASGSGGLWVGKAYGKAPAYHRDPVAKLSHGATAYQVARFYTLLATDKLLSHPMNALMKETLSNPGIRHKFVKGLEGKSGARIYRKSGTWSDYHADSALVEAGHYRYVLVGIAQHRDGGKWLEKLAAPLHDLVVSPAQLAARR
jgi:beta-lactamase class A